MRQSTVFALVATLVVLVNVANAQAESKKKIDRSFSGGSANTSTIEIASDKSKSTKSDDNSRARLNLEKATKEEAKPHTHRIQRSFSGGAQSASARVVASKD